MIAYLPQNPARISQDGHFHLPYLNGTAVQCNILPPPLPAFLLAKPLFSRLLWVVSFYSHKDGPASLSGLLRFPDPPRKIKFSCVHLLFHAAHPIPPDMPVIVQWFLLMLWFYFLESRLFSESCLFLSSTASHCASLRNCGRSIASSLSRFRPSSFWALMAASFNVICVSDVWDITSV